MFSHDAILNTKFEVNWNFICEQKQKIIKENNRQENKRHVKHKYKINDKILLKRDDMAKFSQDSYEDPYIIIKVNDNRTV